MNKEKLYRVKHNGKMVVDTFNMVPNFSFPSKYFRKNDEGGLDLNNSHTLSDFLFTEDEIKQYHLENYPKEEVTYFEGLEGDK